MVTAPGPIPDSHYTLTGYSPQRLAQASSAPGVGLIIVWRRPHLHLAPPQSAPPPGPRQRLDPGLVSAWTRTSSAPVAGPISASRGRAPGKGG